jgi:hypothetical protein
MILTVRTIATTIYDKLLQNLTLRRIATTFYVKLLQKQNLLPSWLQFLVVAIQKPQKNSKNGHEDSARNRAVLRDAYYVKNDIALSSTRRVLYCTRTV